MPADTLENPVIKDQSAAALTQALEAHSAAAKTVAADPGIWDVFAAPKEAPVVNTEEPNTESEKPKVAEVKAEEAKPSEITHETTDEELNKKVDTEAKQLGLTKAARVHLANASFATREAKRQIQQQTAPLQAELETTKAELAKLKEKAPDSDATQAIQKQLEAAQKRIEEQETELAGSRVEKTQMFRKEVGEPMQAIEAKFKKLSADYDIPPEDIIQLTALKGRAQDAKFDEVTLDWGASKSKRLADLLEQHSELMEKKAEVLGRAKQTYDSVVAQEREARDVEQARVASERNAALPDVWDKSIVAAIPTLKGVNGELGEQIKGTQGFIAQADDQWFLKQPVAERVRLTAQAAAFPVVVKHYEGRISEMAAKLADAEKQVKELTAATPGAAGSGAVKQEQSADPAGKQAWENLFVK
jgi:hypothetical protein